jgi:arginine decarboxylase
VITQETITFMRKLDVKEIHGYNAALGLELLSSKALAALKKEERSSTKKDRER